jgi:protoheme IX farnesyltransferase
VFSWSDAAQLMKLRLAASVVFSAVAGFLLGASVLPDNRWADQLLPLVVLVAGGMLVVGSSNAFNQIWEQKQDALMHRTQGRPLPSGRMSVRQAWAVALVSGALGLVGLFWLNPLTGAFGALSIALYVLFYTPLKAQTPWAVLVGAFPGAIPSLLGWVAATGRFGIEPVVLFAVQFFWQFPHFWSLAWVLHDDYQLAGYHLLPGRGGRDKASAGLILFYTLFVIPVGMLPWVFGLTGLVSAIVAVLAGLVMLWPAMRLYFTTDMRDARRLMFASFLYLPVVQLAYVLDRI